MVAAETVREVDERTLPAADNPFEGGDVSAWNPFNIGLILTGTHAWFPPPQVGQGTPANGCTILDPGRHKKSATGPHPRGSHRMLRTNRTSEDAMDHLAGNELFPIFMFLSVGSIALFSFIVTPALTLTCQ